MILKLTKAGAGAIKIQCAILSRSGACQLDMSPASGFDYPHIRIEPRESAISAESCKRKRLQICAICKEFFLAAEEVSSRVKCPTLDIELFGERDNVWGRSKLQVACSVAISCKVLQSYNCDRRDEALSATLRSSYQQIGYKNLARGQQLRRANLGSAMTYARSIAAKVLVESAITSSIAFAFHSAL